MEPGEANWRDMYGKDILVNKDEILSLEKERSDRVGFLTPKSKAKYFKGFDEVWFDLNRSQYVQCVKCRELITFKDNQKGLRAHRKRCNLPEVPKEAMAAPPPKVPKVVVTGAKEKEIEDDETRLKRRKEQIAAFEARDAAAKAKALAADQQNSSGKDAPTTPEGFWKNRLPNEILLPEADPQTGLCKGIMYIREGYKNSTN